MATSQKCNEETPVPVLVSNVLPNYENTFTKIETHLKNMNHSIATQGVHYLVQNFDGQNQEQFRNWIFSIEKYQKLENLSKDACKTIAFQTSSGLLSSFIKRFLETNAECSWDEMKIQLEKRFSDVADTNIALAKLRQVTQNNDESIQAYTERIQSLADIAFRGQNNDSIQLQLIDIFVNGLCNEYLKLTILRTHPETLESAVSIASEEMNLRQRIRLSKPDQIKDENAISAQSLRRHVKCFKCTKHGHKAFECRNETRGAKYRSGRSAKFKESSIVGAFGPPHLVSRSANVKCWGCGRQGHYLNQCDEGDDDRPTRGHNRSVLSEQNRPDQLN